MHDCLPAPVGPRRCSSTHVSHPSVSVCSDEEGSPRSQQPFNPAAEPSRSQARARVCVCVCVYVRVSRVRFDARGV